MLSVFEKLFRLVGIELIISIFKTCYHLVTGTDDDNDMPWFFIFTNRPTRAMEGTM
jgi:hypothetical protein